ncbi:class I SAM-dependent methyltransferase [Acutalibacter sp. 1XD8-36]|uniref:class I SAM-dependent methyltransferase n=1 Tax=Acutalibacter sp. 1XD8-36 TaxID=2320852 RepID=UPI0014126363|nr:class I SAM-dependent methyltransferase [Acutalibacter sp. 1XD8-36]NBJ90893.1 SAM-dependent methyltransferase [Acutalibacter sp. 1XD8-36]
MNNKEIYDFYENGAEIGRLERRLGVIEAARTKELLARYIKPGMTVFDVGGGVGYYSDWLASLGCTVSLYELAPSAVRYAIDHQTVPYHAEPADARFLPAEEDSCDALLLMGPLYHLTDKQDRLKALSEARRILRHGGLLIATGISKFSSATWALSTYRTANDFIDDETYMDMLRSELTTGEHHRPDKYPRFIAEAYFHTPESFADELKEAGFAIGDMLAIEGIIWPTPDLNAKWEDTSSREHLLELLRLTESEPSVLGYSPHFMAVASK